MKKRNSRKAFAAIAIFLALAIFGSAGVVLLANRYYPLRHTETIKKYSVEYGLEPELVCALIRAESRFKADAVSRAGASGLMQIMEDTAYWLAPRAGLDDFDYAQILDPETNIRLGTYYLSILIEHFGDIEVALCAYNAGRGNVASWLDNPEYSSDGKTLDAIPYAETREYVQKVMDNEKIYGFLLRFENIFSR